MTSAEMVKAIRKQLGLSQVKLGKLIGVSGPQICNIESGRNDIPGSKLLVLFEAADWKITPPEYIKNPILRS